MCVSYFSYSILGILDKKDTFNKVFGCLLRYLECFFLLHIIYAVMKKHFSIDFLEVHYLINIIRIYLVFVCDVFDELYLLGWNFIKYICGNKIFDRIASFSFGLSPLPESNRLFSVKDMRGTRPNEPYPTRKEVLCHASF